MLIHPYQSGSWSRSGSWSGSRSRSRSWSGSWSRSGSWSGSTNQSQSQEQPTLATQVDIPRGRKEITIARVDLEREIQLGED